MAEQFHLEGAGGACATAFAPNEWAAASSDYFLSEVDMVSPTGNREELLWIGERTVTVDSDFANYIRYEAARRGVAETAIYEEEISAKQSIDDLEITEAFLANASQKSRAPATYLAGDQDCPF